MSKPEDPADGARAAGVRPGDVASLTIARARELPLGKDQLLVVYDGACGVCSRIAGRMMRLDRRARVAWMPSQRKGLAEAAGLTAEDVATAAWAVTPGGQRARGAAAMLAGLDAVLLGNLGLASALYRVPGLRQACDAGYAWFAGNRGRFGGTATCDIRPPSPIDPGSQAELAERGRRGGWGPLPQHPPDAG